MIDPLTSFSSGIKKGIKAWLCVCRALISRGQIKFWSPKSPFSDSSLGPGGQQGQVRRSAGRTAMPPTQSLIHGNPAPKLIPRPDFRVDHGSSWIIMVHLPSSHRCFRGKSMVSAGISWRPHDLSTPVAWLLVTPGLGLAVSRSRGLDLRRSRSSRRSSEVRCAAMQKNAEGGDVSDI